MSPLASVTVLEECLKSAAAEYNPVPLDEPSTGLADAINAHLHHTLSEYGALDELDVPRYWCLVCTELTCCLNI